MRLYLSAITTIFWAAWENRTPIPSMASWYNNHYTNAAKLLQSQACRTPQTYDSFVKDHYYIYNFVPPQGFKPWPADSCSDMLIHYTIEVFEHLVGFEPTMNYWFCRPMVSTTRPQVHICWGTRIRIWTIGIKIQGADHYTIPQYPSRSGRIRTLGGIYLGGFGDRCLKPLGHRPI